MAAWVPSKSPCRRRSIFPPPLSSAGVPRSRTVIPSSAATGASPVKAASALAAMMLWPQACPIPGRASYSAQRVTTSSPVPISARTAVGKSPNPWVIRAPATFRSSSASHADALISWYPSSGFSCRRWLNPVKRSRIISISARIRSLMPTILLEAVSAPVVTELAVVVIIALSRSRGGRNKSCATEYGLGVRWFVDRCTELPRTSVAMPVVREP